MLPINTDINIPLKEIEFTYVRSSGPGGQNVNKVASKAVLRWSIAKTSSLPFDVITRFCRIYPSCVSKEGVVVLSSQLTRDAPKNKADCLEKLREMILVALRKPKPRIPTKPTAGSIRRRLADKARHAEKKERRRQTHFE